MGNRSSPSVTMVAALSACFNTVRMERIHGQSSTPQSITWKQRRAVPCSYVHPLMRSSRSWISVGSTLERLWVLDVRTALSGLSTTPHSKIYMYRRVTVDNATQSTSIPGESVSVVLLSEPHTNRKSYVVTGGNDAILGIWDMQEWMCVRTCSPYECVSSSVRITR